MGGEETKRVLIYPPYHPQADRFMEMVRIRFRIESVRECPRFLLSVHNHSYAGKIPRSPHQHVTSTIPPDLKPSQRRPLETQPTPQYRAIPHHRPQPHQICHTTHTMQHGKLPIQPLHLPTMRPLIIRHLPIPRLLMLPLHHNPRGLRPHIDQIHQRSREHSPQQPRIESVGGALQHGGGGEEGKEARGAGGVGEQQADGEGGLEREVDGEGGFLERAELGPGKGAVGDYARDEGLEEGAAEEGAVAVGVMLVGVCRSGGGGLPEEVVCGGILEGVGCHG